MIHLSPLDPEMPLDMMESDFENFYTPGALWHLVPWRENAEGARGGEPLDEVLLEAAGDHAERLKERRKQTFRR